MGGYRDLYHRSCELRLFSVIAPQIEGGEGVPGSGSRVILRRFHHQIPYRLEGSDTGASTLLFSEAYRMMMVMGRTGTTYVEQLATGSSQMLRASSQGTGRKSTFESAAVMAVKHALNVNLDEYLAASRDHLESHPCRLILPQLH